MLGSTRTAPSYFAVLREHILLYCAQVARKVSNLSNLSNKSFLKDHVRTVQLKCTYIGKAETFEGLLFVV